MYLQCRAPFNVVPERADGRLTLTFDQQVVWDLADAKASLPSTLKSIEAEVDLDSVAVVFALNGAPEVRTFREDRSIVVDIGLGGAKQKQTEEGAATKQAATSKGSPAISSPGTVPAKNAGNEPATHEAPIAVPSAIPALKTEAEQQQPASPESIAAMAAQPSKAATISPEPGSALSAPPTAPTPTVPQQPSPALVTEAPPPASATPAPAAANASKTTPQTPMVAEAERPAANPVTAVVARVHQSGETMRVEFPFAVPTPAAVFQRADTLWLVFDSAAPIDLAAFRSEGESGVRDAKFERAEDGAAIVRIKLARPRMASIEADGPGWVVNIADTEKVPTHPLGIARSIIGKNRASIAIPFDSPRAAHSIADPDAGDRLMVITALGPARGFLKVQDFVELRALPSTHGVVVQPIADDIAAELAADKITISRPSGLSLSATSLGQQQVSISYRAYTFDTQLWGFDRDAPFNARQSELIGLAAAAPVSKRRQARLNLARFYLAKDMAPEAKAVLDVARSEQRGSEDVTGSVLTAVANVMLDRPEDALKELSKPQVGDQQDAPIWRAIAYARQGRWAEARDIFKTVASAISALPIELQRMAMKEALRSAIEVRDFNNAARVANEFETVGITPELEPIIDVLIGRLYEGLGRAEDALTSYRAAALSGNRRAAAQGRLREIVLAFATGGMARKDVISELETLTSVWRGDETETEGLKLLAHLYTEDNRYRDAFHVMRTALLAHPDSDIDSQDSRRGCDFFREPFPRRQGRCIASHRSARVVLRFPRTDADRSSWRRNDPQARRSARLGRSARPSCGTATTSSRSPSAGRRARPGRDPSCRRLSFEP